MARNSNLVNSVGSRYQIEAVPFSVTLAAQASGDTVDLLPMKAGWKVVQIHVDNAALGASTTVSIGDTGNATRYTAAISTASAGNFTLTANRGYTYQSDDTLQATIGGGAATGVLSGMVLIQRTYG